MYCQYCGFKEEPGAKYCSSCGKEISENSSTELPPPQGKPLIENPETKRQPPPPKGMPVYPSEEPKRTLLGKAIALIRAKKPASYIVLAVCLLFVVGLIANLSTRGADLNDISTPAVSENTASLTVSVASPADWSDDGSPFGIEVTGEGADPYIVPLEQATPISIATETGTYKIALDNDYYLMGDGSLVAAGEEQSVHLQDADQTVLTLDLDLIDYAGVSEKEAEKWIESAVDYIKLAGDEKKAERLKALALEKLFVAHIEYIETGVLRTHFIDVGQGDSTFIELPSGMTMLIDAGPASASDTVVSYIKSLGYERIDFLVATHPHEDHIGGMTAVINGFSIGEVWAPKVTHTTQTYEGFLDAVSAKGLKIKSAVKDASLITQKDMTAEILSPARDSSYTDLNDWSAIIEIKYKDCVYLFTGDASASIILAAYSGHVDVLKVGHHGSSTSTTEALVSQLSPTHSVISCGASNSYGHPTEDTLKALSNTKIYRTDTQGTIIAECDGKTIQCNKDPYVVEVPQPEPEPEPEAIAPPAQIESFDVEVYITNTGAKYHRDGCRHLKSRIPTTLSAAKAQGYEPCKTCNPPT